MTTLSIDICDDIVLITDSNDTILYEQLGAVSNLDNDNAEELISSLETLVKSVRMSVSDMTS